MKQASCAGSSSNSFFLVKNTLKLAFSWPVVLLAMASNSIAISEIVGWEPDFYSWMFQIFTLLALCAALYFMALLGHRWPKWLVLALTPLSLHFYLLPDSHFASPQPFENLQFWLGTFALGTNLLCFTIFTRMQGFWPSYHKAMMEFRHYLDALEAAQKEEDRQRGK